MKELIIVLIVALFIVALANSILTHDANECIFCSGGSHERFKHGEVSPENTPLGTERVQPFYPWNAIDPMKAVLEPFTYGGFAENPIPFEYGYDD